MADTAAIMEKDEDVNIEETAQVRSLLQYATDFRRLDLRSPEEEKPLNVIRSHIGRRTKVTDVVAVAKSIMFKSECFELNRFLLLSCFISTYVSNRTVFIADSEQGEGCSGSSRIDCVRV